MLGFEALSPSDNLIAVLATGVLAGMIHVFAGPDHLAAGLYLLAFALGSIAGMLVFTGLLGRLFARLRAGGERAYRFLLGGTGLAAVAVGVFWLVR